MNFWMHPANLGSLIKLTGNARSSVVGPCERPIDAHERNDENNRPISLHEDFQRERLIIKLIGWSSSPYPVQSVYAPHFQEAGAALASGLAAQGDYTPNLIARMLRSYACSASNLD